MNVKSMKKHRGGSFSSYAPWVLLLSIASHVDAFQAYQTSGWVAVRATQLEPTEKPIEPQFDPGQGEHIPDPPAHDPQVPVVMGKGETEIKGELGPVGEVKMPASLEAIIAIAWIICVGSMPFVIGVGGDRMSKTHVIESACLVVWLSLAVFFFTSLCRFQSSHFEGDRPLTMVESVYFMSQIITSVGYGDIVPSFFLGKVIVMLYIWFAVIIIGNLVSSCVEMINERLEDYLSHKAKMKFGDAVKRLESAGRRPTTLEFVDEKSVDYVPFLKSLAVYILMAFVGIVFFSSYPGEGKAWYQAMYMSVVTLSTVGFGSYTAETEAGKAFGAFWMLFGCVALGNMISKGIDLSITLKQHAAVDHEKDQQKWIDLCERMDTDKSGTISDLEFLKIGLVYAGFASEHEVEQVHRFFLQINHSTNKPPGTPVPTRKLKQLMAPPDVPVSGLAA